MLNELAEEIRKNSIEKSFHIEEKSTGEVLAIIHSEVSGALLADMEGAYCRSLMVEEMMVDEFYTDHEDSFGFSYETEIQDSFEDKLACAIIQILGLAASKGIDIDSHIQVRMKYNRL